MAQTKKKRVSTALYFPVRSDPERGCEFIYSSECAVTPGEAAAGATERDRLAPGFSVAFPQVRVARFRVIEDLRR